MTQRPTPVGWYPDPERSGLMRYWDGAEWTRHLSSAPPSPGARPTRVPLIGALAVAAVAVTACAVIGAIAVIANAPSTAVAPAPVASTTVPEAAAPPGEAAATLADPAVAPAPATPVAPTAPAEPVIRATKATVVRVVDGDTAVFRMADGTREKVRFIGIDTPESTNAIEPYGREASAYTKRVLKVGRAVLLEKDVEARDKYGRLLAYVWLARPTGLSAEEVGEKMFNARLARDGYAQQMTIQPNSKYAEYFHDLVAQARDANEGLWDPGLAEEAAVVSAPARTAAPSRATAAYIGNRNTRKFHFASCSSVGDMNESNKVPFDSRDEAVSGGFIPCKRCDP